MRHNLIKKVLSLMIVAAITSSTMVCYAKSTTTTVDNLGKNTVKIFGEVEPTIISIDVTLDTGFVIKPNETKKESRFISPVMHVQNTSNVPFKFKANTLKHSGTSPAVVGKDKYTQDEWDKLGLAETNKSIALGLKGNDSVEYWFTEESTQTAPIELGLLGAGESKDFKLVGKHGLTWSQKQQLEYDLVFSLEMVK